MRDVQGPQVVHDFGPDRLPNFVRVGGRKFRAKGSWAVLGVKILESPCANASS